MLRMQSNADVRPIRSDRLFGVLLSRMWQPAQMSILSTGAELDITPVLHGIAELREADGSLGSGCESEIHR